MSVKSRRRLPQVAQVQLRHRHCRRHPCLQLISPTTRSNLSEFSLAANALASLLPFPSYKTFVYTPWVLTLVLNLAAAVIANAALVNATPASAALANTAFAFVFATAAITITTIAIASLDTTASTTNAAFANADLVSTAIAAATHTSAPRTRAASTFVNHRRITIAIRNHRNQTE